MKIFRFGDVINGKMILNDVGKMIEENLIKSSNLFNIGIDIYIIMPNHLHVIFTIENHVSPVGDDFYVVPKTIINQKIGQTLKSVPTKTNNQLSISEIIQRYKTFTTNQYIKNIKQNNWTPFHEKFWQRSFYDHVIRCDESLDTIRQYILNNPLKWQYDRNNPNRKPGRYRFEM